MSPIWPPKDKNLSLLSMLFMCISACSVRGQGGRGHAPGPGIWSVTDTFYTCILGKTKLRPFQTCQGGYESRDTNNQDPRGVSDNNLQGQDDINDLCQGTKENIAGVAPFT